MYRLAHGMSYISPNESLKYKVKAQMYAGDNTNYYYDFKQSLNQAIQIIKLTEKLLYDTQTWERYLRTPGGLLKLDECLFYIIQWTFNKNELLKLTNVIDISLVTIMSGNTSAKLQIEQNNFDTTLKILGNRMSPSLQMRKAL